MVGSRRALMIGLLMLVTAVAFEAQAVSTAMPAVAADLGQLDLYAWAFTAFVIPQIVAIVVAGRLCDRLGPVRPLQAGIAVFAAGVVASACAVTMPWFLAGRFIQGFGGGLVNLAVMVVVGRAFPPAETGRVMTWFSFAWMLPSFIGPTAAAWIVRAASWHVVFWVVLPLVLAGAALLWSALAGFRLPGLHDPDAAGAPLPAAVIAALGVAMVQGAGVRLWWGTPLLVGGGAACLALTIHRLMPTGWRPLAGGFGAVIATRALVTGAFFASGAFLPLMINRLRGQGIEMGGYVLTVASLGWTLGSWFQSRGWLRISRDAIVTLGVALVVAGLAVTSACTFSPGLPLGLIVAAATLSGTGMGLASSSTSILAMQLSRPHELGKNTSSLQVGESLGNALTAGLAGTAFALADPASQPVAAFGVPSLFVALCALVALVMSRRIGHVQNLSARPATDLPSQRM